MKNSVTLSVLGFMLAAAFSILVTDSLGQLGMSPIQSPDVGVIPTYIARIIPGAAQRDSPHHYYPENIAIPTGITIQWSNDDPGQPHTVTSGLENSSGKGSVFNSGIIPYTSSFQYTFSKSGEYIYHCDIHPWRVAKVSVNNAVEKGNNFVMTSGTGPTLNLTKNDRTLLDFRPTTVTVHETTPITYNITIAGKNNSIAFSREFFALGNDLQLELISTNNTEARTTAYGPDVSDPITGAYHVQGDFLKPGTDYKIIAQIIAIGSQKPPNAISDTFGLKVTS